MRLSGVFYIVKIALSYKTIKNFLTNVVMKIPCSYKNSIYKFHFTVTIYSRGLSHNPKKDYYNYVGKTPKIN